MIPCLLHPYFQEIDLTKIGKVLSKENTHPSRNNFSCVVRTSFGPDIYLTIEMKKMIGLENRLIKMLYLYRCD